jgi:hypothetical protein
MNILTRQVDRKYVYISMYLSMYLDYRLNALHLQLLLNPLIHLIHAARSQHLDHLALLLKLVHHRHARLLKRAEALANRLDIVVVAATRLAPLQQPAQHDLLGTAQEQHKLRHAHRRLEEMGLVELARKPVDQEARGRGLGRRAAAPGQDLGHGVREQRDGDFHGHDRALPDVRADELAVLAAGPHLLGAQQVAGRQMAEAVVAHEVGRLRAFAGAGAAEDEDHGHGGGGEAGCGACCHCVFICLFRGARCRCSRADEEDVRAGANDQDGGEGEDFEGRFAGLRQR